jgi:glycosyltransferase involved in cell wall biosynthesis
MRVLVISNLYPSRKHPSFGVFVRNFQQDLERNGVTVLLCTIKGKSGRGVLKLLNYTWLYVRVLFSVFFRSYDIVYVHYAAHPLLPIALVRNFLRKPLVVNFHGEDLVSDCGWEFRMRTLTRHTIESSNLVVVPSDHFAHIFLQKYNNRNIFVSPSGGIDLKRFSPHQGAIDLNAVIHFGYAARIEKGKGWLTLLRAAEGFVTQHQAKFYLHIVGTGSELMVMKSEVKKRGLENNVRFYGELDHSQLPAVLRKLHFFVLPSELNESLGLIGLEALSSGVPVIASDLPAFRTYLIDHVNGWFFKKGDYIELGLIMKAALSVDIAQYLSMRHESIKVARQYDSQEMSSQLFMKLKELIE